MVKHNIFKIDNTVMKKTLNVNIGSVAFTMDEDAYFTLNNYYEDIRSRLYENERGEVMEDIESRTADIFRESMAYPSQVVSLDMVKRAIAIIGNASTFGEQRYDRGYTPPPAEEERPRKLYRSRDNSVLGGVCGGLADYLNVDAAVVRILAVLLLFLGGLTFWIYIVLWIALPLEPHESKFDNSGWRKNRRER